MVARCFHFPQDDFHTELLQLKQAEFAILTQKQIKPKHNMLFLLNLNGNTMYCS